jgi:hypothetical protein
MSDGGSAFPFKHEWPNNHVEFSYGLSLRDYFAAHAMHDGMRVLFAAGYANLNEYQLGQAAKAAYLAADAMLAARIPSLPGAMSGDK